SVTATTPPSPLPLHDALPIYLTAWSRRGRSAQLRRWPCSLWRAILPPRSPPASSQDRLGSPCSRASTSPLRSPCPNGCEGADWRSEEHTSELQSRGHLVCRLL